MQKRSEAAKQEKFFFRTKLKHTAILMLCIMFAFSTIYAVDISTYRLMKNDNDQYAMRITIQNENILRVDIVGKRYDIDIQNIRAYASRFTQQIKSFVTELKSIVR